MMWERFWEQITWERLTERAKWVIIFAQQQAVQIGHGNVSAEHLLLGLVQGINLASCILAREGVSTGDILNQIEPQMQHRDGQLGKDLKLTHRFKQVIRRADSEARQLSNKFIGTEHLLLALLRDEGLAGQVLTRLGVTLERVRSEVQALQESSQSSPTPRLRTDAEIFVADVGRLSSEQREALIGSGLAFSELPERVQQTIQSMVEAGTDGGTFVLNPNAPIRVNVNRTEGVLHGVVTGRASFLVDFLSKEA